MPNTLEENILPPKIMEYPIFRGQIESAKGNLGNFKIKIDGRKKFERTQQVNNLQDIFYEVTKS